MSRIHRYFSIACLTVGLVMLAACLPVFAAVDEPAQLNQMQQQIISLRNDFQTQLQKAERERLAIYEELKTKLEETIAPKKSSEEPQPDALAITQQLQTILDGYAEKITAFEQTLTTIETTMNQELETIETKVAEIKKRGIRQASATPGSSAEQGQEAPSPLDRIDPGKLFQIAYRFYIDGEYDVAIAGFEKFLSNYPKLQLAGAAQYWIAESLVQLGEYDAASQEYDRLIKTYPRDDKIPDAYYGKGVALLKKGNAAEAKTYFTYVIENFQGTLAETKARARLGDVQ